MVFSSLLFLFRFLPLVFLLYYLTPRRGRNVVLFLFSLFFYAWGEPKYVFLMLFSITMDYTVGRLIDKAKREGKPEKAKGSLLFSVFMNLGILGFFKYADFIIGSINAVSGLNLPLLNIPLPIGISFFTFQTMSYTIDVEIRRCRRTGSATEPMSPCSRSSSRALSCSIRRSPGR